MSDCSDDVRLFGIGIAHPEVIEQGDSRFLQEDLEVDISPYDYQIN